MDTTFLDLYKEFQVYLDKDDEQGARDFLINNLERFPEGMQEKLIFAFFQEALVNKSEGMAEIADMQKEGLEVMSKLEKAKRMFEDQLKIKNLRSDLTK